MWTVVLVVLLALAVLAMVSSVRVLSEYERGVVFRLGRLRAPQGPGLLALVPVVDRRDGPGRPADGDTDDPAAGGHHP
jgi:regulator of protease activity HflC (stomatin/prohibitin superfamily)